MTIELTHEQAVVLSENNRELLKQIISEAKISGISKEDFLKECEALYKKEERSDM